MITPTTLLFEGLGKLMINGCNLFHPPEKPAPQTQPL